jgi:hypothetical protein
MLSPGLTSAESHSKYLWKKNCDYNCHRHCDDAQVLEVVHCRILTEDAAPAQTRKAHFVDGRYQGGFVLRIVKRVNCSSVRKHSYNISGVNLSPWPSSSRKSL